MPYDSRLIETAKQVYAERVKTFVKNIPNPPSLGLVEEKAIADVEEANIEEICSGAIGLRVKSGETIFLYDLNVEEAEKAYARIDDCYKHDVKLHPFDWLGKDEENNVGWHIKRPPDRPSITPQNLLGF